MRADDLLGIDVAAEVMTLCGAQLQGPWQVPAELVRLANARGAARVEIDRRRGGFSFRCDGVLALPEELYDLAEVFNLESRRVLRQAAINRVEAAGLSALMWATGLPGARLELEIRTGCRASRMRVRRGRVKVDSTEVGTGPPSTILHWRCRRLGSRRAVAWLRTALRFVPIPVAVCGRPVDRGFPDGLYRMRIKDPLPGEIAVTVSGEAPRLWLLEHGVLSARAVIPGYPAFSAAVEISGAAQAGSSADELRAAANPYLTKLIDEAVRMLVLLVERVPSVDEAVRSRLCTLLLQAAARNLRRTEVLAAPIVSVREGSGQRFESPVWLASRARAQSGVVAAIEPGNGVGVPLVEFCVEATTEERGLLSELLDIRIEGRGAHRRPLDIVHRLAAGLRQGWRSMREFGGKQPLGRDQLSRDERRLMDASSAAGIEMALCAGAGSMRRRRTRTLVGRDRPEVRAAARAVADSDEWLYPVLLAVTGGDLVIPDEVRARWIDHVAAASDGVELRFE